MAAHVSHFCLKTLVPCGNQGCIRMIPRSDIKDHQLGCEYRLLSCKQCGQEKAANQLASHQRDECSESKLPCEFAAAGCTSIFTRKEVKERLAHMETNLSQHLLLIWKYFKVKEAENKPPTPEIKIGQLVVTKFPYRKGSELAEVLAIHEHKILLKNLAYAAEFDERNDASKLDIYFLPKTDPPVHLVLVDLPLSIEQVQFPSRVKDFLCLSTILDRDQKSFNPLELLGEKFTLIFEINKEGMITCRLNKNVSFRIVLLSFDRKTGKCLYSNGIFSPEDEWMYKNPVGTPLPTQLLLRVLMYSI